MGAGLSAKKIIVIIIFLALSAINDIPYVSRALPYYLKQFFSDNTKQLIVGDIKFGITTGDILVRNIKIINDKKESDISADSMLINIDLAALISRKRMVINNLQISGLKINYIVSGGKSNLDFLKGDEAAESDNFKYLIRNILFSNAELNINYEGDSYHLKNINFNIPELSDSSKNINLFISGAIERGRFMCSLNISPDGSLAFNAEGGSINLALFKNQFERQLGVKLYTGRTNFSLKGEYSGTDNSVNLSGSADFLNASIVRRNYTVGFKNFQLTGINYSERAKKLDIDSITAGHFYTKLFYDFNEKNEFKPIIQSDSAPITDTSANASIAEAGMNININKISFMNATIISVLNLKSDTLQTTFDKTDLNIDNLKIDSGQVAFNSNLKASVNGGGSFNLTLQYNNRNNYSFNLNLQNAALPNFNAYFKDYIGYVFELGKADLTAAHSMVDSQLNSRYSITLHNPAIKKTSNIFDVPLEFAIKQLKNSKGVVKLDIPMSGNINDLNFKFSKAFWRIVRNTVLTPFTLITKPFDTKTQNYYLLPFNFNESVLTEDSKSALESAGRAVRNRGRKNFTIELNLAATLEEFNLPHLETLFKRRVNQIEQYLLKNFNIEPDRILYKEIRRENIKIYEKELIELILID